MADSAPMQRRPDGEERTLPDLIAALICALVFGLSGCAGPSLQPWHTEHLTLEFTADQADEVQTFEDYRRLEDRLFEQLDEEIYAHVETGPQYTLSRYSPGSAADPRMRDPDWNRSFELPVDDPVGGVLLLHGMSDSPYTLRTLARSLNGRGYSVVGLRLPGHGTAPSGLKYAQWEDMAAAVRLFARHLAGLVPGKPIHIVGYSTGAPLAVDYSLTALEEQERAKGSADSALTAPVPASMVLISPAIGIHRSAALAGFKAALGRVPGFGGLAWLQVVPEFDPYKYNSFATNAGAQVHALTSTVSDRLRNRAGRKPEIVLPPTLVLKSTVDATVSNAAVVDRMFELLLPNRHELVLFDINRSSIKSGLMISDPSPFTDRLMADDDLPFSLTIVTNENPESLAVVALYKPPFSSEVTRRDALGLSWPLDLISLSHLALPIRSDDPLYGRRPPENEDTLFLGEIAFRGERGLLVFPADWLLRLRYNPFYSYLEARTIDWMDAANGPSQLKAR
jgi:alpha-beta hydrolase superfamily lysophospholipase